MSTHPARDPNRKPIHPGAPCARTYSPPCASPSPTRPKKLGISRRALHANLAERAAITPEMAVRLGKFCGNGPDIWIKLQTARDLWTAKRKMAAITDP